jgi:hypothetical protein
VQGAAFPGLWHGSFRGTPGHPWYMASQAQAA